MRVKFDMDGEAETSLPLQWPNFTAQITITRRYSPTDSRIPESLLSVHYPSSASMWSVLVKY